MKHCDIIPNCPGNIKVGINTMNSRCIPSYIYKTVVLKPNFSCCKNVLCQRAISEENVKYVIKYDFDLLGDTIVVPKNCILEFDGGSLKHGTIVGQDTLFINVGDVEIWGENLKREGTWREYNSNASDREYDPAKFSGMGKVYLKKNIIKVDGVDKNVLVQDAFYKDENGQRVPNTDTIFVVMHDFDLNGEEITMPENSVLEFDGGSVNNGKLISNNTEVLGNIRGDSLFGCYYLNGKALNYNYKKTKEWKTDILSGFITPNDKIDYEWWPQSVAVTNNYYIYLGTASGTGTPELETYCYILLFDKNFNFKGSTRTNIASHGNDCAIRKGKLYVAMSDTNINKIAVFSISEIINSCLQNTAEYHSAEYNNPVGALDIISLDGDAECIDYDEGNDEFAVLEGIIESDLNKAIIKIYDSEFNLIKETNTDLRTSLNNYLGTVGQTQAIVYKNGIVYGMFWNHKLYATDNGQPIIVLFDVATDSVIEFKDIHVPFLYTEPEGIFKDPTDDNNIFFLLGNLPKGCAIAKSSNINEVTSLISKTNNTTSLYNSVVKKFVYVDNSYEGYSNGTQTYPFKSLDEAIICVFGFYEDLSISLKPTQKKYFFPEMPLRRTGKFLIDNGGDNNNASIIGNLRLQAGWLELSKINFYHNSKGAYYTIYCSYAAKLIVTNSSFINEGEQSNSQAIMLYDMSSFITNNVIIDGYNKAINARTSYLNFAGETTIRNCNIGIEVDDYPIKVVRYNALVFDNTSTCMAKGLNYRNVSLMFGIRTYEEFLHVINYTRTGVFGNTSIGMNVANNIEHGIPIGSYVYNGEVWRSMSDGFTLANNDTIFPRYGATEERPTNLTDINDIGFSYFDKTIGREVHWTGNGWDDYESTNGSFGGTNLLFKTHTASVVQTISDSNTGEWRIADDSVGELQIVNIQESMLPKIKKGIRFIANGRNEISQSVTSLVPGIYTISCYVKGTGIIQFKAGIDDVSVYKRIKNINNANYKKISCTLEISEDLFASDNHINIYIASLENSDIYMCAPKVESGNISSEWCPNPTDFPQGGDTNHRPADVGLGYQYFDTDLNKMIVWNGTNWVNLDGTPLV